MQECVVGIQAVLSVRAMCIMCIRSRVRARSLVLFRLSPFPSEL